MKKLIIVFKDNSQITYTMKDRTSPYHYLDQHSKSSIKSAVLNKYPLKDNEPVILI